jgi:hypothetical protein
MLPSGTECPVNGANSAHNPGLILLKLFVKNLKAPSAKGAVTSSDQKEPYMVHMALMVTTL